MDLKTIDLDAATHAVGVVAEAAIRRVEEEAITQTARLHEAGRAIEALHGVSASDLVVQSALALVREMDVHANPYDQKDPPRLERVRIDVRNHRTEELVDRDTSTCLPPGRYRLMVFAVRIGDVHGKDPA